MPYGRANVMTDLEVMGNRGLHCLLAQRPGVCSTSSLGQEPAQTQARDAALAALVGSGNCGEFAGVAAHAHAKRMQSGEPMDIQRAKDFDHCWVLLHGRSSPGGTVPRVVLDVWGEGPVIEACDGQFTADPQDPPLTLYTIGSADAADANRHFEEQRNNPRARTQRQLDMLTAANTRYQREPTGTGCEPSPIVADTFRGEACSAVQARREDPQLKQAAAALGRQVASLAPGDEAAAVTRIVEFAAHLDTAQTRHLIAPSAKRPRLSGPGDR
jgi:hypothetical protein